MITIVCCKLVNICMYFVEVNRITAVENRPLFVCVYLNDSISLAWLDVVKGD